MHKRILAVVLSAVLVLTGMAGLPEAVCASEGPDVNTFRGSAYMRTNQGIEGLDTFYYSDEMFTGNSLHYNSSLATFSVDTAAASLMSDRTDDTAEGYANKVRNLRSLLEDVGFIDFEASEAFLAPIFEDDTAPVACAHKQVTDKGKDYTLLAIIPKSGTYGKEYGTDFMASGSADDTDDYYDFRLRVDPILSFAKDYIKKHDITGDIKVWTIGYSRGAGIENLVGAALLDDPAGRLGKQVKLEPANLYCYTLGTPKSASLNKDLGNSKYEYIHNVFDENDFIAELPPASLKTGRYGSVHGLTSADRKDRMLFFLKEMSDVDYEKYLESDPADYHPLKIDRKALLKGDLSFVEDDESYLPYDLHSYGISVFRTFSEFTARSSKSGKNTREGYYNEYQEPLVHLGEHIVSRIYNRDTAIIENLKSSKMLIPLTISMYLTFITDKHLADKNAKMEEQLESAFNALASFIEDENGNVTGGNKHKNKQYYDLRNAFFSEKDEPEYSDGILQKYEFKYDIGVLLKNKTLRKKLVADQKKLTAALYAAVLREAMEKTGYDQDVIDTLTSEEDSAAMSFMLTEMLFGNTYQSSKLQPFSLENEQFKQLATLAGNASRLVIEHSSGPFRAWMKTMDPNYDDYIPADAADYAGYRRLYINGPEGVTVRGSVYDADGTEVAKFENGVLLSSSDEWVRITKCDTGNWLRLPLDRDYKVIINVSKECELGLRLGEYSVEAGEVVNTVTGDKKYDWTALKMKRNGEAVLTVPAVEAGEEGYEFGSDSYYHVEVAETDEPVKVNPISVRAKKKAVVVKYRKLKKARRIVPVTKLLTVNGARGTLTYSKVSVNKRSSRFRVDPKTGNVTVRKKTKRGTYKIKIMVTASGGGGYAAGSRTVTCRIRVR